jgi:hypothetical protein
MNARIMFTFLPNAAGPLIYAFQGSDEKWYKQQEMQKCLISVLTLLNLAIHEDELQRKL